MPDSTISPARWSLCSEVALDAALNAADRARAAYHSAAGYRTGYTVYPSADAAADAARAAAYPPAMRAALAALAEATTCEGYGRALELVNAAARRASLAAHDSAAAAALRG